MKGALAPVLATTASSRSRGTENPDAYGHVR
jgi:hypothetical protein